MIGFRGIGVALITAGVLVGCVTAIDQSLYRHAGGSANGQFRVDPSFIPSDASFLTPAEVFTKFDKLCYGGGVVYVCAYFVDDTAYYLLPNYGVVPTLLIRSHAKVIVDARTGALLKNSD